MAFKNRTDAGTQLARALSGYAGESTVVYALPRGGVVLGAEVARRLHAPLGVIISRKIGHLRDEEYAVGAVTETGTPIWNESERLALSEDWRQKQVKLARAEARRRRLKYQGDQPTIAAEGMTAIVVDDGIATSLTMIAAVEELRRRHPREIVVAVPVAPEEAAYELLKYVDKVVVLQSPQGFAAIGASYSDFPEVDDEEVRQLLGAYRGAPADEPLDLAALNSVVATIKHFPVTSGEVAARARRLNSPANVVGFFESIPSDTEFATKADIMQRSDEVETLMEEEKQQPDEYLRSYDL